MSGWAEEGHLTERFTQAMGQLGDTEMAIRLGGIYALERIAKDSEKDHGPIMAVLTAYVREKAPRQDEEPPKAAARPATDIQAILTVIGRRETTGKNKSNDRLDLRQTQLVGANLYNADLVGAELYNANLAWAFLSEARLGWAILTGAILVGAELYNADLYNANLDGAILTGANLDNADLYNANLDGANLDGAHPGRGHPGTGAENLTAEQVRSARNWRKATLPDYLNHLKDLPDSPRLARVITSDKWVLC